MVDFCIAGTLSEAYSSSSNHAWTSTCLFMWSCLLQWIEIMNISFTFAVESNQEDLNQVYIFCACNSIVVSNTFNFYVA